MIPTFARRSSEVSAGCAPVMVRMSCAERHLLQRCREGSGFCLKTYPPTTREDPALLSIFRAECGSPAGVGRRARTRSPTARSRLPRLAGAPPFGYRRMREMDGKKIRVSFVGSSRRETGDVVAIRP